MFGLFNGIKYRNEVITQIHAILMLVPRLKSLTSPLKDAINQYRKENTREIEAAVWLSLVVIEKPDGLHTAGHTSSHSPILERKEGWQLSLVRQLCPSRHGESETGTPGRHAEFNRYPWLCFWYLLVAVQQNKLSENVFRTFIHEVVGMLRQNERDRE
jgi:hypothetical protein